MKKKIVDNIYEIITKGVDLGIGQLYTEDHSYDKNTITFSNKKHINFGSYSYLSFERDNRLKEAAIDAIRRYGIQFPSSRTYVSSTPYKELEFLLTEIFNAPVVLSKTTTLAHVTAMPIVVEEGDVIIIDQQVHSSVQFMVSHLKQNGINFHIVRHNDMNQLEEKIQKLSRIHKRVWYMCDGVYSMYGDTAPFSALNKLQNKYKKFHLYIDDAHGMSWTGENGKGYALSKIDLNEKIVLVTSLNKAFAAGGAVIVVQSQNLSKKIKTCGGPLIFAGQHQSSALGASIACCKIHLSNEINKLQGELEKKIAYCHDLLTKAKLPVISNGETPIFFIGVGLPAVGYNMVEKMINSGFLVNLAIFPAVSETCTGIRFTIVRTHTLEQITKLVHCLKSNFNKALEEESRTLQDISRAFRKVKKINIDSTVSSIETPVVIEHYNTINKVRKQEWSQLFKNNSMFDWKGLQNLEKLFKGEEDHNKWKFDYFILKDDLGEPIFATYTTICLTKDDALAESAVSYMIEEKRLENPYYLCSRILMLGCPISMGTHYYIDKNKDWKKAIVAFIKKIEEIQDNLDINGITLRDFKDREVIDFLSDQGFIKTELPNNYLLEKRFENYMGSLRSSQRYFVKQRALSQEEKFSIITVNKTNKVSVENIYKLYENVSKRSFELNLFKYPKELIELAINDNQWDVLILELKNLPQRPVAVAISYVCNGVYNFLLAGLDYSFVKDYNTYAQLLWQIVKRSENLNCSMVNLGYTTGQNKRKFGAKTIKSYAMIRLKDNYNVNLINHMTKEAKYELALKDKRQKGLAIRSDRQ